MSKTVITSSQNSVAGQFDKRFGRAAWFCIYDLETKTTEFIENEGVNANQGAGTKAAEQMVALKVNKIISGDFGPKAKDLLEKFNVQMVVVQEDNITVQDIINKLK